MQVQAVNSSVYFNGKFLDKQVHRNLANLLYKMNKQTVYVEDGSIYKSSFLKKVQIGKASVVDIRGFLKQMPEKEQLQKETILNFGRTQLIINNENGEIVGCNKPLFSSLKSIVNLFNEYIKSMLLNFDNPSVVKKNRMNITGLTQKGIDTKRILDVKLDDAVSKL